MTKTISSDGYSRLLAEHDAEVVEDSVESPVPPSDQAPCWEDKGGGWFQCGDDRILGRGNLPDDAVVCGSNEKG